VDGRELATEPVLLLQPLTVLTVPGQHLDGLAFVFARRAPAGSVSRPCSEAPFPRLHALIDSSHGASDSASGSRDFRVSAG
jgi:hypothetical protein